MDDSEVLAHQVALMEKAALEDKLERERRQALVPVAIRSVAEAFVRQEKGVNAQEKFFTSATANILGARVDKQMVTERALGLLEEDLKDATGKSLRGKHLLEDLEVRTLRMRAAIRASNDAQDVTDAMLEATRQNDHITSMKLRKELEGLKGMVRSAEEVVADELAGLGGQGFPDGLEACPKCTKRYLPGLLIKHLATCDGSMAPLPALAFQDSDEEEGEGEWGDDTEDDFELDEEERLAMEEKEEEEEALAEAGAKEGRAMGKAPDGEFEDSPKAKGKGGSGKAGRSKRVHFSDVRGGAAGGLQGRFDGHGPDEEGVVPPERELEDGLLGEGAFESEAEREERLNQRRINNRNAMAQCPICRAKVPPERIVRHQNKCLKRQRLEALLGKGVGEGREVPQVLQGPPLPPTTVRVMAPSSSSIPVVWTPPESDGGSPILDYQVEYFMRIRKFSGGRWVEEDVRQPAVSTSRWVLLKPVCTNGFTVRGVPADTQFAKLRVRAVNRLGHSEWSTPAPPFKTMGPSRISPPLHFACPLPPTPRSLLLTWETPMDAGGQVIQQYELHYEHWVGDAEFATRTGNRVGTRLPLRVRIPLGRSYTLLGLDGGAHYTNFTLYAVSKSGELGAPSTRIPSIILPRMPRREEVERELAEKGAMRNLEVEVWLEGRPQRFSRLVYLQLLEKELFTLTHAQELEEQAVSARKARAAARVVEVDEEGGGRGRLEGGKGEGEGTVKVEVEGGVGRSHPGEEGGPEKEEGFVRAIRDGGVEEGATLAISGVVEESKGESGGIHSPSSSSSLTHPLPPSSSMASDGGAAPEGTIDLVRRKGEHQQHSPSKPSGGGSSGSVASSSLPSVPSRRAREKELDDIRRDQFQARIRTLSDIVRVTDEEMMQLSQRRRLLKSMLLTQDKEARVLRAELWRVRDAGEDREFDTTLISGRLQRFKAPEFREALKMEAIPMLERIGNVMVEVRKLDDRLAFLKARKDNSDALLGERQASYDAFEARQTRLQHAFKYGVNPKRGMVYKCFRAWVAFAAEALRKTALKRRVLSQWLHASLARGWRKWKEVNGEMREAQTAVAVRERRAAKGGVGAVLLLEVERQRQDGEVDAMKLLAWLRTIEGELDSSLQDMTYRRALKGLTTLTVTMKGVSKENTEEAWGIVPRHRSLGPPSAITQPLENFTKAMDPPRLALVDDFKQVTALQTQSDDPGTDILLTSKLMATFRTPAEVALEHFRLDRCRRQITSAGPACVLNYGLGDEVEDWARAQLSCAQAFLENGHVEKALVAAKKAEMVWGYKKEADKLLAVYRFLALLLEKLARHDLGVIHWARCIELSKEDSVNDPVAEAEGWEGKYRCLLQLGYVEEALGAAERAEDIYEQRNDLPALARVYRSLARIMATMRVFDKSDALSAKAEAIEQRSGVLLRGGIERLAALEQALGGQGITGSRRVQLELVGPEVALLRQQCRFLEAEVSTLRITHRLTRQKLDALKRRLEDLDEEIQRADASQNLTLVSTAFTGEAAVFKVSDLRVGLRQEAAKVSKSMEGLSREFRKLDALLEKSVVDLAQVHEWLEAEGRQLAQLVAARRPLGVAAFNYVNLRANEVLGVKEGCVPHAAVAVGSAVYVHSLLDGAVINSFVGDVESASAAAAEPFGHTKRVTALATFGTLVFSGSADATIRVWDMSIERGWGDRTPLTQVFEAEDEAFRGAQLAEETLRRQAAERVGGEFKPQPLKTLVRDEAEMKRRRAGCVQTLLGHNASVTALAVNDRVLVSGSADKMVYVWGTRDGKCLRRLKGHDLAISCIALDDAHFATGSQDGQVRLWHISQSSPKNPAQQIDLLYVYAAHRASVTALCVVRDECVSGDADGKVIVWDKRAPLPLRIHALHEPGYHVKHVQFSAATLVTFALDRCLVISDLSSGEKFQTAKNPHGDALILAMSVDTDKIVTIASDHSLRVWGLRGGAPLPAILPYKLKPGMKLANVGRVFGVSTPSLLRWNCLRSENSYFTGMRVVVAVDPEGKMYGKALRYQAEYDSHRALAGVGEALNKANEVEATARAAAAAVAIEERELALKYAGVLSALDEPGSGGGGGGGWDELDKSSQLSPNSRRKKAGVVPPIFTTPLKRMGVVSTLRTSVVVSSGSGSGSGSGGGLLEDKGQSGAMVPYNSNSPNSQVPIYHAPPSGREKSEFRLAMKIAKELDVMHLAIPPPVKSEALDSGAGKKGGVLARRIALAKLAAELQAGAASAALKKEGGDSSAGAGAGTTGTEATRTRTATRTNTSAQGGSSRTNTTAAAAANTRTNTRLNTFV